MKRVIQFSIDLLADDEVLNEQDVRNALEKAGFNVLGIAYGDDMTSVYESTYPELLED